MTWEELKQEAKKMGALISESELGTWDIKYKELTFSWCGTISTQYSYYDSEYDENYQDDKIIAEERNADQMFAIMKALQ
jgi:hypothetical protein